MPTSDAWNFTEKINDSMTVNFINDTEHLSLVEIVYSMLYGCKERPKDNPAEET